MFMGVFACTYVGAAYDSAHSVCAWCKGTLDESIGSFG